MKSSCKFYPNKVLTPMEECINKNCWKAKRVLLENNHLFEFEKIIGLMKDGVMDKEDLRKINEIKKSDKMDSQSKEAIEEILKCIKRFNCSRLDIDNVNNVNNKRQLMGRCIKSKRGKGTIQERLSKHCKNLTRETGRSCQESAGLYWGPLEVCERSSNETNFTLPDGSSQQCRPKNPGLDGTAVGEMTCGKKTEKQCKDSSFLCKWGPTEYVNKVQDDYERKSKLLSEVKPKPGKCRLDRSVIRGNPYQQPKDFIQKGEEVCSKKTDSESCDITKDYSDDLEEARTLLYPSEEEIEAAKALEALFDDEEFAFDNSKKLSAEDVAAKKEVESLEIDFEEEENAGGGKSTKKRQTKRRNKSKKHRNIKTKNRMSFGKYKSKKGGAVMPEVVDESLKKMCSWRLDDEEYVYVPPTKSELKKKRDDCYLLTSGTKNPKAEIPFGNKTVPNPRLCVWQPTEDGLDGQCDTNGVCIKDKLKELREAKSIAMAASPQTAEDKEALKEVESINFDFEESENA